MIVWKDNGVTKYIYRDNQKTPPKVVFECNAENILEADALYRVTTKNDPVKQPYVGCECLPLDDLLDIR